jgi:uncharacterized protein YdeI (BOF family)
MKFHKLEVYVFDFEEGDNIKDIIVEIEQNRHFNMEVKAHQTVDIGEWDDDHELNLTRTSLEQFRAYFEKNNVG